MLIQTLLLVPQRSIYQCASRVLSTYFLFNKLTMHLYLYCSTSPPVRKDKKHEEVKKHWGVHYQDGWSTAVLNQRTITLSVTYGDISIYNIVYICIYKRHHQLSSIEKCVHPKHTKDNPKG
jgi:hypothetical protein